MSTKGIPLDEALEKYSPRAAMDEFDQLKKLGKRSNELARKRAEGWQAAAVECVATYALAEGKRVSAFLDQLKTGKLIATGYDLSQPLKSAPSKIPAALWHTLRPEFRKSAASGGGARFGGILVASVAPSTVRMEGACKEWFKAKVSSKYRPDSWATMFEDAKSQFGENLSERSFKRTWKELAPQAWKKPGRKSRRRIDTPS